MDGIRRVYIDIMIGGRFYRQLPYNVINKGNVAISELQAYVCRKLPTLKDKTYTFNFSSNRVLKH